MKELLVTPSLYTLFLYTLINKNWDKSDYVLSSRIPVIVHDNLKKMGIDVYSTKAISRNKLKAFMQDNIEYINYLFYSMNKKYDKVYGNDEFHLSYKYRNSGIELIEDGSFNSESREFFIKRRIKQDALMLNFWVYWYWRNYLPYGYDRCVKVIWHTPNITLPLAIQDKGHIIDMVSLWNGKSQDAKKKIISIFSLPSSLLSEINNYSTVLVTQALPIPDEEKIEIYKGLTKDIDESTILIKTHYAENINYEKYFPKAKVVSAPVPFQLFDLMGFSPKKILTVSSSAILPFIKPGVDVTFLGTEIDDRIKNVYGIIRYSDLIKHK